MGYSRVKVLPDPGWLSTRTRPPCAFTMCVTMARPMPVPAMFCRFASAPRTNFPKMSRCSAARHAEAAIVHVNLDHRRPLCRWTVTHTVRQSGEYLTALSSRFHNALVSACGSAVDGDRLVGWH